MVENKGLNLAGVEIALDIVSKLLHLRTNVKKIAANSTVGDLLQYIDAIFDDLHFDIN